MKQRGGNDKEQQSQEQPNQQSEIVKKSISFQELMRRANASQQKSAQSQSSKQSTSKAQQEIRKARAGRGDGELFVQAKNAPKPANRGNGGAITAEQAEERRQNRDRINRLFTQRAEASQQPVKRESKNLEGLGEEGRARVRERMAMFKKQMHQTTKQNIARMIGFRMVNMPAQTGEAQPIALPAFQQPSVGHAKSSPGQKASPQQLISMQNVFMPVKAQRAATVSIDAQPQASMLQVLNIDSLTALKIAVVPAKVEININDVLEKLEAFMNAAIVLDDDQFIAFKKAIEAERKNQHQTHQDTEMRLHQEFPQLMTQIIDLIGHVSDLAAYLDHSTEAGVAAYLQLKEEYESNHSPTVQMKQALIARCSNAVVEVLQLRPQDSGDKHIDALTQQIMINDAATNGQEERIAKFF